MFRREARRLAAFLSRCSCSPLAPAALGADKYVALGDSFSSGVGTGSYTLSSSCRRGVYAYPGSSPSSAR